jgi:hypothetical protein
MKQPKVSEMVATAARHGGVLGKGWPGLDRDGNLPPGWCVDARSGVVMTVDLHDRYAAEVHADSRAAREAASRDAKDALRACERELKTRLDELRAHPIVELVKGNVDTDACVQAARDVERRAHVIGHLRSQITWQAQRIEDLQEQQGQVNAGR